jgi:hypothetical protein
VWKTLENYSVAFPVQSIWVLCHFLPFTQALQKALQEDQEISLDTGELVDLRLKIPPACVMRQQGF